MLKSFLALLLVFICGCSSSVYYLVSEPHLSDSKWLISEHGLIQLDPDLLLAIRPVNSRMLDKRVNVLTPVISVSQGEQNEDKLYEDKKNFRVDLVVFSKSIPLMLTPADIVVIKDGKRVDAKTVTYSQSNDARVLDRGRHAGFCADSPYGFSARIKLELFQGVYNCISIRFRMVPPDPTQPFSLGIAGLMRGGELIDVPIVHYEPGNTTSYVR
jgi:hypothetical protein